MKPRRRTAAVAALAVIAWILLALTASAQQVDPRYPNEQPQPDQHAIPRQPAKVVAGTGELTVSPTQAHIGDTITASYANTGGVLWHLNCPNGATYVGKSRPATAADDVPLGAVGGPTSCSWKVGAATTGTLSGGKPRDPWVPVTASITGPCGRPSAVAAGKAEYAIGAGGHSDDSYMVLPSGDNDVAGSVSGVKGEPVAGMLVELTDRGGKTTYTVSDRNGRYGFFLDKDNSYTLRPGRFEDRNYGVLGPDDFSPAQAGVGGSGSHSVDFKVKGQVLGGRVADSKGKALVGAVVEARSNLGAERATVSRGGTYEITLPKGKYAVRVTTPAPPDPARNNRFWGASYYCRAPGAGAKDSTCSVDLSSDHNNVDFKVATELKLSLKIARAPDNTGRRTVTAQVTDDNGDPVGNQQVEFKPQAGLTPRMLVENNDGNRVWPDAGAVVSAIAAGADSLPPAQDSPFTLSTDDQGLITFSCWPGTQGGDWKLGADIPGSTDPSEEATADVQLPEGGSQMPADGDLSTSVDQALQAGIPHPAGDPNSINTKDPNVAQNQVLKALSDIGGKLQESFTPIHSSDHKHAGILFMPKSPPPTWLQHIGQYLVAPTAAAKPTEPARVLDMEYLVSQSGKPGFNSWSQLGSIPFQSITDWLPKLGDATATPQLGAESQEGDARVLTSFGFPPLPREVSRLDAAAGLVTPTFTVQRRSDAPVNLAFTDATGATVSDAEAAGGPARVGIAGASVSADAATGMTSYRLPIGAAYNITVRGTGDGKAILTATSGLRNENLGIWTVAAKRGTLGTGTYHDQLQDLEYGGKTINRVPGLGVQLAGLPRTIPQGTLGSYRVKVTDETGSPIDRANVKVDTGDFVASALTDPTGYANLRVYGPRQGQAIDASVRADRHLALTRKLAAGPPGPPEVPASVRRLVGPEQAVYMPRRPGGDGPLGVIELAAVLALSGIGVAFARRGG